jgi:hypothetical protein
MGTFHLPSSTPDAASARDSPTPARAGKKMIKKKGKEERDQLVTFGTVR